MRSEDRYISLDIRGPRRIVQNEPKQILLKSERCIAVLLYHYKVFPFFLFFFFFFLSFFFLFFLFSLSFSSFRLFRAIFPGKVTSCVDL